MEPNHHLHPRPHTHPDPHSKQPPKRKRIAIIGAGCSGLTAIKCCLDEGLEPLCLEKSRDLGGLWNFAEKAEPGTASIYKSLVINTSKDMMMFSDFPAPDSFPAFLTHAKVLEYFRLYAENFRLVRHISFRSEVKAVEKAVDYDVTGRWRVTWVVNRRKLLSSSSSSSLSSSSTSRARFRTDGGKKENGEKREEDEKEKEEEEEEEEKEEEEEEEEEGAEEEVCHQEVFDGVMVCTGHHSVPFVPRIDGLNSFQGHVLHSHSYKEPNEFKDKNVVIVGMGNSAMDIACDLAKTAKQVTLASRRGAWIVPKTAFWGLPADMLANSRVVFTLPFAILDWCVQIQANFRLDHVAYNLRPEHGVLNCHPCINDELPIHLVNGRIVAKANVQRVDTDGVWLEDGDFCPCDVIVLATGYDYRLDILGPAHVKVQDNRVDLYKYVFPTHLPHPTLAVVGLIQAIGAVMPIAEMQSRWFARLLTGQASLPSSASMADDIASKRHAMDHLYVKSRRHTMQTFWIDYMDEIATLIGAKPNLRKMLLRDPELALKCYLGPCLPAQFRLTGPHPWAGARSFILSAMARASKTTSARQRSKCKKVENNELPFDNTTNTADEGLVGAGLSDPDSSNQSLEEGPNDPHHQPNPDEGHFQYGRRRSLRHQQRSPEWMSLTFYVAILLLCCFAWLISLLISKAEWLINFLDSTVGRYMPLSD